MDKEQIKKALDHFENDQYTAAKEILSKEISAKRDQFLKDKLGLKESINEGSKEDAKKTLDAIIGATKDDGGDVYDMAVGMRKSYEKNGGFSKDQAQWIFKTSQALFKK